MSSRRKLQHIDPQHPPDEEDCNYCTCNVNEPVGGCLRLAEIEHGGILARGPDLDGARIARRPCGVRKLPRWRRHRYRKARIVSVSESILWSSHSA
jgi:hypothetical protein